MPDARDLYALAEQAVIESALAMGVTQGHVVNTVCL
jgi:ABC-type phosphate transport system permease subunit